MADLQTLVRSEMDRAGSPSYSFEDLSRRRARRNRNRRMTAAVLAIILALVSFAALIRTFRTVERPAKEPTDIFARVHGWIAYGNKTGIWAVDPSRGKTWEEVDLAHPGEPGSQVQLSDRGGEPQAWSSDGTKLLIWRDLSKGTTRRLGGEGKEFWNGLFVLNADGSEIPLTTTRRRIMGASLSPDGSKVIYAVGKWRGSAIYMIDAEGGMPQVVLAGAYLGYPTFSPDGTQIAYVDGGEDWDNKLWVMNADGSGARLLLDPDPDLGLFGNLAWSPDGSRLAFSDSSYDPGIWVVGANGSGVRLAIAAGLSPQYWSPDGSRIAYSYGSAGLAIADSDGTHVRYFGYGGSGPWNPLPQSESGYREPTSARVPSFIYAIVALALAGVALLGWRARRSTPAK